MIARTLVCRTRTDALIALLALSVSAHVADCVAQEPIRKAADLVRDAPLALTVADGGGGQLSALLEEVCDSWEDQERTLANVLVRGRHAETTVDAAPMNRNEFPQLPAVEYADSDWRQFEMVAKDGRRRYECEVVITGPSGKRDFVLYRLFNDEGLIAFDDTHMELFALTDTPEREWRSVIPVYYDAWQVFDGRSYSHIPVACSRLIESIRTSESGWEDEFASTLRCSIEPDGLITFEVGSQRGSGRSSSFVVDATARLTLVRSIDELRSEGFFFYKVIENEYQNIAPGVDYLRRSRQGLWSKQGEDDPAWDRYEVSIDSVQFGDFDYDESKFETASLPVPKGAIVSDHRSSRARQFTYGTSPLNEEDLLNALGDRPNGSWRRWLVAANIAIIASVTIVLFARRMKQV